MKKVLSALSSIVVCTILFSTQVSVSSCTKETIIHDTTTVHVHDTTEIMVHDTVYKRDLIAQHINDNLWAYYPFNGDVLDKSGNNRVLTLKNGLGLSHDLWGKSDSSLKFDGSDDYAVIEDGRNFPEGDFTLAIKFTCPTLKGRIFQKADYTTAKAASVGLGFASAGGQFLHYGIAKSANVCDSYTNGSDEDLLSSPDLFSDSWYHVVIEQAGGIQKLYLNGKLIASQPTTLPNFTNCTSAPFNLGVWWQLDPDFFTGRMDDIRIYTRGLKDEEVAYLSECSMQ